MRFLVQRVAQAQVTVNHEAPYHSEAVYHNEALKHSEIVGKIKKGFLVFVGISETDNQQIADRMVKKLVGLRIFEDENNKTNLDLKTVGGQLLIISQFTLYADCRKGNRPSFVRAGEPGMAEQLYRYIITRCRQEIETVEEGSFGADMQVSLVNDGPFTVLLDSEELCGC